MPDPTQPRMILPTVTDFYDPEVVTRYRELGYWNDETPASILDELADRRGGDLFALDRDGGLSYGEFRRRAWRFAAALVDLGVERGDRVVVQVPNWTELLVAMMGVTRAGAVLVPAMMTYRPGEVGHLIENTQAKASVTAATFRGFDHVSMHEELRRNSPWLEHVVVVRGDEPRTGALAFNDLIAGEPAADAADLPPMPSADDGHVIIHTSGTESKPKGCFHSYNTLGFSVRTIERTHGWTADDISFGPSPVVHSNGYLNHYLVPLRAGAATVLMEQWEPRAGIDLIDEFRCTATVTATTFLTMAVDARRGSDKDLSSMRLWVASGATIPARSITEAREVMPDCEILSQYGRSENQLATNCPVGTDPEKSLTSDGEPPEGVEIVLFDQDGGRAGNGPGDVGYRGPGHMLGYVNQPELTATMVNAEGFSLAGDLAVFDDDGYLRITGRLKDIIIRGGVNISAREVEELLLAHPSVKDVALVGMPDPRLGERACAFVVPTPGSAPTLDELCGFLRDERGISVQKLPERLEVVDHLPVSATGKVQKVELRERVARVFTSP
ncbi:AMP-binding protein [Nocardioides halotolerans]|uniref:AMP-binding protein n=1 Tax=Nocardioides halotolerans TaxID=433660 RepID=UPI0003F597BF|nr:AMP-binding protein [Nocardioides halotolerans]